MFVYFKVTLKFVRKWKLWVLGYLYFVLYAKSALALRTYGRNTNSTWNPRVAGRLLSNAAKPTCFVANCAVRRGGAHCPDIFQKEADVGGNRGETQTGLHSYHPAYNRTPAYKPGSWLEYYNRNDISTARPRFVGRPMPPYRGPPPMNAAFGPGMAPRMHPGMSPAPSPFYGPPRPFQPVAQYQPGMVTPMNMATPFVPMPVAVPPAPYQMAAYPPPNYDAALQNKLNALNKLTAENAFRRDNIALSKEIREQRRMSRYCSFRFYTDVIWTHDDTRPDDWPGTDKISPEEEYYGIIHYYFTPCDALVLLINKKVEGSISLSDLPPTFAKTTIKDTFKLDHLLKFKLKDPLEFDEKGRPKFVVSEEASESTKRYAFRARVRGTPVFFTNTMAVLKLEDGVNYAQVFLVNTGIYLTFPVDVKMIDVGLADAQIMKPGEQVELEVLKGPYEPRAMGYLCRIPFDSPKGVELRNKYRMVFEDPSKGVPRPAFLDDPGGGGAPGSSAAATQPAQQGQAAAPEPETTLPKPHAVEYKNLATEYERMLPFESETVTLREYVRRIGGNLKLVLGYLSLKTKTIAKPSREVSPTLAKMLLNFVKGRRVFHVEKGEEDEEFRKLEVSAGGRDDLITLTA